MPRRAAARVARPVDSFVAPARAAWVSLVRLDHQMQVEVRIVPIVRQMLFRLYLSHQMLPRGDSLLPHLYDMIDPKMEKELHNLSMGLRFLRVPSYNRYSTFSLPTLYVFLRVLTTFSPSSILFSLTTKPH